MIIQFSNGGGARARRQGPQERGGPEGGGDGLRRGRAARARARRVLRRPLILHTDHCSRALLPWFDALLEANEEYFAKHGEPLFSSHMLDLSEESIEENMEIAGQVPQAHARRSTASSKLQEEIGITGA